MLANLNNKLTNLKLAQQVSFLLLVIFVAGIILSGIVLGTILNYHVQNEITSRSLMLMDAMQSVRNYTDTQVSPELNEKLETEFLPQAIPSYAVREIFEKFRQDKIYSDFFYKDAVLNPTNLRDKADDFEAQLIKEFRQDSNQKEKKGFRSTAVGNLFYIARPIKITNPTCLKCHSTPSVAPQSMIERYGKNNGFGWQLNKILGIQIILIPASKLMHTLREAFLSIMSIILLIFGLITLAVNLWLRKTIIKPIKIIEKVADEISTGNLDYQFDFISQKNEIGKLATAFNRLKTSLILAINRLKNNSN